MGKKAYEDRGNVHKTILAVAVSPNEKEKICKAAANVGLTMSAYIRYKLFSKEAN